MAVEITPITPPGCLLGEGPVWDVATGTLIWVDIKRPAVHAIDVQSGAVRRWPMPAFVGAIGLSTSPTKLVGAFKTGLAFIDLSDGSVEAIADPEPDRPDNRFNDGKVDPMGRFWAGSMDDNEQEPTGHLYCLAPDLAIRKVDLGFVVTNGIDWSLDGRTMYVVDTTQRRIYACEFDMAAGTVGARRLFAEVPAEAGYPDGLTVDAEDHVWGAHWSGSRLTRYRPDGTIDRVIDMPVPLCTSCCFGGPDLATLYVTSATIGLDQHALEQASLSGAVFAVSGLGIRGRPPGRFGARSLV